jgi:hypothetical protein
MKAEGEIVMAGGRWAEKLLRDGNKYWVNAKLDEHLLVYAIMNIPNKGNATGTHTGKRMSNIKKYKCLGCLIPEYEVHAKGSSRLNPDRKLYEI